MDGKPFWKSKTFWVGVLTILVGFLSTLDLGGFGLEPEILRSVQAVITMVVGLINIVLRFVTKEPIQ